MSYMKEEPIFGMKPAIAEVNRRVWLGADITLARKD